MYISDAPADRVESPGTPGLADDADQRQFRDSFAAVKAALDLNPKSGYVKGSPARKKLEDAFESVPRCLALKLAQHLVESDAPLARLFRFRLHDETKKTMVLILARKAKECLELEKATLERQDREERRRLEDATRRTTLQICAKLKESDGVIDELCRKAGTASDLCRSARAGALKNREEQLRATGVRCP